MINECNMCINELYEAIKLSVLNDTTCPLHIKATIEQVFDIFKSEKHIDKYYESCVSKWLNERYKYYPYPTKEERLKEYRKWYIKK